MQMTFRWYGEGNDSITPAMIRQIPGVSGLVWALHHKQAGEVWETAEIETARRAIEGAGFHMDVVESVNVHDDIKIGLPTRDKYIENYKQTLRNLAPFGVKVVTYNFMPIFDWTRTDLFHPLEDGSTALFYERSRIRQDYKEMADYILNNLQGLTFPGWEPERMARLDELFEAYRPVTKERLWDNLRYFLEALMPTCRQTGIKLAIHPDDPPWDIFGLPRLLVDKASIGRFLSMVDDEHNALCLCTGSLGANPENDLPDIIRTYCDRIAFAHVRNVRRYENGDFTEVSHRDRDGDVGILEIMKAFHDCGYKGYMRPDHGRHIFGETCRPGYGLYDRALGIMYLLGCWDMLENLDEKK